MVADLQELGGVRKLGKISNTSLISVSPIFPVRRKVVQSFLASVSYFQRPSRRGAGGTKKRKIGTKERRQRKTTKKDDLSNSIAQTVGAISGQFGGRSVVAIVEFLDTKIDEHTCVSSKDRSYP